MSEEKDRFGEKIRQAEIARENQWARQRDEEILERLRKKYVKAIKCPQCSKNLDARVAIGVGGMACPQHHGAWADRETLDQLIWRLKNAGAIQRDSRAEQALKGPTKIVEDVRHKHPNEIDCPDCGVRLEARAAVSEGAAGLAGMACSKSHGAWIDQDMLAEIRKRLEVSPSAAKP